jgi:hypothetical protein
MTDIAFDAVRSSGGRTSSQFSFAPVLRSAATGFGAVAAIAVIGVTAIAASGWILSLTVGSNPRIHNEAPTGPRRLALSDYEFKMAGAAPSAKIQIAEVLARNELVVPLVVETQRVARVDVTPLPPPRPHIPAPPVAQQFTQQVAQVAPPATMAPTSLPVPAPMPKIAPAPAPKLALAKVPASPIVEKPQRQAALPPAPPTELNSKTAVYDISARTVFLPNGRKLEAHSGIGDKMDDPRYANVRMRGVTPPNVYDLKLREALFHGVRAIRLTPTNESAMFGRDGILAHTYMLGPSGQSNGCVSFRDYDKFLQAFLDGQIDRLVVVPSLGNTPYHVVSQRHRRDYKYAAN